MQSQENLPRENDFLWRDADASKFLKEKPHLSVSGSIVYKRGGSEL